MHQGWSNGPGGTLYVCRLDPWGHLVKINLAIWGRIRRSLTTVLWEILIGNKIIVKQRITLKTTSIKVVPTYVPTRDALESPIRYPS